MAVNFDAIRTVKGYENLSDDQIRNHFKANGVALAGDDQPQLQTQEASGVRSHVGIPIKKGDTNIGGYNLGTLSQDVFGSPIGVILVGAIIVYICSKIKIKSTTSNGQTQPIFIRS